MVLHALDRFGYAYNTYIPHFLSNHSSCSQDSMFPCLITPSSTCNDTLVVNDCSSGLHKNATQFIDDDENGLYILYKHNKDNELYLDESYSIIKKMNYLSLEGINFICELIGYCGDGFIGDTDSLSYDVNDIFYRDNKIYVANPSNDTNSFSVYQSQEGLIDSYNTESEVRSIFASNDYILAGTNNGCYITLLEGDGISDNDESKLVIAENFTVYDIHFDQNQNKLILSVGSNGVLVYNWDGNSFNVSGELRIYSSYSYTARFINDMYFVATKNGLEIYNIGD